MTEIDFTAEVEKRKAALLADLTALLRVNSERDDAAADATHPFGPGPAAALEAFLAMAARDGYATRNVDNYVGDFVYGEGAETLGILGHLDVVPALAQEGWTTNPYEPVVKDGNLYARGASDDKGPLVACYYGLKILKDLGVPLSKQIRFIAGTDEESGWADMEYYFAQEGVTAPDFGFSPDAEFPIINGEKGNVTEILHFAATNGGATALKSFVSGHRENMVPEVATAVVTGADLTVSALTAALEAFVAGATDKNLRYELTEAAGDFTITLHGKGAHGAMPEQGVSAATHLALFLRQLDFGGGAADFLAVAADRLLDDHDGSKIGIAYENGKMGNTSMNAGIWDFTADKSATIHLNLRYPEGNSPERIEGLLRAVAGVTEVEQGPHAQKPHYVPADDPLVATLLAVYEKHTGKPGHEVIIGGGTFGRLMKRGVAYGAMFDDEADTMHKANEYKPIANILKAAAIYAEAIYELAK